YSRLFTDRLHCVCSDARDNRLAASDISLQQPVHGDILFQVTAYFVGALLLIPREVERQRSDKSFQFIDIIVYDITLVPHPLFLPSLHQSELEHEQFVKLDRPAPLFYVRGAFRKMDQPESLPHRQQTVFCLDGFGEIVVERKAGKDFSDNLIESLRMHHFPHRVRHAESAARFVYQSLSIDLKLML